MCDRTAPRGRLRLEWVYGYRGYQVRNNVLYSAAKELVYFTARVCVVYNAREHTQRYYCRHDDDIISLAQHPDRVVVASGQVGAEPLVCVWDTYSTSTVSILQGAHTHGVSGLAFSADGQRLVSVGLDSKNTVCVWDWRRGRVLASASGHTDRIFDVSWDPVHPERLVSCGVKHIKFWTLWGSCMTFCSGSFGVVLDQDHNQTLLSLGLRDDVTFSGALSGDVLVWKESNLIRTIANAHQAGIFSLQVSEEGFCSGGRDGCVRLWDPDFNPITRINLRETPQGYTGLSVRAVCWRADRVLAGTQGGEVFEILVQDRDQPVVLVQGHGEGEVWALDTHPKQQVALTGGDDGTIRLWSLLDHRLLARCDVGAGVRAVTFHPDGSVLAVGLKDGSFTVLRVRDMSEVVHVKERRDVVHELKFSPDAALLAVGCNDGAVDVYATAQRYKKVGECRAAAFITHLDWSVDSRVLQTNDGTGTRAFYRMPGGRPVSMDDLRGVQWMTWTGVVGSEVEGVWPKYGSDCGANAAHANISAAVLATAQANGQVRLYRFPCSKRGAQYKKYSCHSAPVTCVRWSSDVSCLVSVGGADRSVLQWSFVPDDVMGGALEPLLQETGADSQSGDSDSDRSDVPELDSEVEQELQSDLSAPPLTAPPITAPPLTAPPLTTPPPTALPLAAPPPTHLSHDSTRQPAPPTGLRLNFVHGFRGWDTRSCLVSCLSATLVFPAASLCVVFDRDAQTQRFYRRHQNTVSCVTLHPGGATAASGQVGGDAEIHVWDVESLKCLSLLRGHEGGVCSLDFTADGRSLVSLGLDQFHSILIWDWRRGEALARTRGHKDKVLVVKSNPFRADKLVSAGVKHILFWQHSGGGLSSRRGVWGSRRTETLLDLVFGPAEDLVFSGSSSGDVFLWKDTRLTKTIKTHEGPVFSICPLDQGFVTGGKDGIVGLWDQTFERCLKSFAIKRSSLTPKSRGLLLEDNPSVRSISLGNGLIFIGTKNGEILEIDKSGSITLLLQGHMEEVRGLDCHPLLPVCASISDDKTLRLWELSSNHRMVAVRKLKKGGRCVSFSPLGHSLGVGLVDGSVLVVNADSLDDMVTFHHRRAPLTAVRFSPGDGRFLAAASLDSFVDIYDVVRSRRVGVCRGAVGGVTHLDWDVRGKLLQVNTSTNQVLFFEAPRGKRQDISQSEVEKLHWASWSCVLGPSVEGALSSAPVSASVTSDLSLLATGDAHGRIRLYRYPCRGAGSRCKTYSGHSGAVTSLRWTNQDTVLLSVGGATLMMWQRDPAPSRESYAPDSEDSDSAPEHDAGYDSDVSRERTLDFRTKVQTGIRTRPQPQDPALDQDRFPVSRAAPLPDKLLKTSSSRKKPPQVLVLDHVFGFRGRDSRNSLHFLNDGLDMVLHTARVAVVQNLSSGTQSFYLEHSDEILSLTVNQHPKFTDVIATGDVCDSPGAQIRVWDARSKHTLSVLSCRHGNGVCCLSFSATGKLLLSIGLDPEHSATVWRWREGSVVACRGGHRERVFAAEFRPDSDSVFVSVGVKHVRFWSVVGGALIYKRGVTSCKPDAHNQTMTSLAFGADGVTFTGGVSGEVWVWREHVLERVVEGAHSGPVLCMSTSLQDGLILTGAKERASTEGGAVKLWDPEMKRCRAFSLETRKSVEKICVRSVCRTNGRILVGTSDGDVVELEEKNLTQNVILSGFSAAPLSDAAPLAAPLSLAAVGGVLGLDTHPIRDQLATTGHDATLRVWDLNEKRLVSLLALGRVGSVCCFSPGGDLLCVGFRHGEVLLLTTENLSVWRRRRDRSGTIQALRFSPDGRFLAVGFLDSVVDFYDLSLGPGLVRVGFSKVLTGAVMSLDFSSDSGLVQVGTSALCRQVLQVPGGKVVPHSDRVTWATWTSVVGEEVQGAWSPEVTEVTSLSASHSGVVMATGDDRGGVHLLSFPPRQAAPPAAGGHSGRVSFVRFSCDDKYVISSGSTDGSVMLWRCL